MIDLGKDLDVVGAVAGRLAAGLTEVPGQVAQVFRTELDGHSARPLVHGRQVALAIARQNHLLHPFGNLEMASHPFRAS